MKRTILIVSCEHAVNTIPACYQHLFERHASVLETHRAIDFGAMEIARHLSETLGCEYIKATVSRLVIDCNRSLNHRHCFSEFTTPLPKDEKQTIIDRYYLPYRQKTEQLIKNHIDRGHQVFHLSSHSFTPIFNNETRNAGIGLLYDPKRHGEKEVARLWHGLLSQKTHYRIRMNYPYSGSSDGFTSALRKKHEENSYLGIELEINQALVKNSASINSLKQVLSSSLFELLQML